MAAKRKLLNCPFCNGPAAEPDQNGGTWCTNIACFEGYVQVDTWNKRPVEESLLEHLLTSINVMEHIKKHAMWLRGEKAYREFPRFVRNHFKTAMQSKGMEITLTDLVTMKAAIIECQAEEPGMVEETSEDLIPW